jgi:hypothetical protein
MSAGLAASTVTPGKTAPVVSRTTPAIAVCACAKTGLAERTRRTQKARVDRPDLTMAMDASE